MMKLTDREWKPFAINTLFERFTPGKCSAVTHLEKSEYGIEYIGATNHNNGVLCYLAENEENLKLVQDGNCIGFIKDGDGSAGYAIYKRESFVSTVNVIYGYASWLNSLTGLFFVGAQDMIKHKYSHGYKRNMQHLKADHVMLPADDNGQPDYQFMADYERELIQHKRARYSIYAQKQLDRIGDIADVEPLSKKQWDVFRIDQLFDSITRPSARSKNQYDNGDVPFIASSAILNGAVKFCTPHVGEKLDESNCITVSPVDGSSFYQTTDFLGRGGGGSSIIMLRSSKINQYSGMFVARAIHNTTSKYQYGHMATSNGITRDQIILPVNDKGEPDYDYMEQYIKNKMIQKYKKYLEYLGK